MTGVNMFVDIDYTNYRGERRVRRVYPLRMHWGSSEYHPVPQWFLHALDVERGVTRDFAMVDIHSWAPVT